ncbi:MAG: electron transfer flavoprotein subunit beta/FixA family protein [Candidatus Gastranaerophilales bacterium]|nr:electron transfer flavoprotein subunit beta/FixA family protein [Candidatus Gastranaerophilales bacterium]
MNIVVCIKQVPDVEDIKWTKENNLDRANMLSKINPQDEWALDWAISIKAKFENVKITAISMGPNQAKEVLSYALAKGVDRAILLSDKAFCGSDTLVTSKIIAAAIKKLIPDYNLIITGNVACDGDTAQVPVSLAQLLLIPDVIGVNEIINADKNMAIVSQKLGQDINIIEIKNPCLLAVKSEAKECYIPKIEDYIRAQNMGIETYGLNDLSLDKNNVGIVGSPTMVWRAYRPEINKSAVEIKEEYSEKLLEIILRAK